MNFNHALVFPDFGFAGIDAGRALHDELPPEVIHDEPPPPPPLIERPPTLSATLLTVTKINETTAGLTWNPVQNANGYFVVRDGFKRDAGNVTRFTVGSLPAGQHNFWIVPYLRAADNNNNPVSNVVPISLAGNAEIPPREIYDDTRFRKPMQHWRTSPGDEKPPTPPTAPVDPVPPIGGGIINFIKSNYLIIGGVVLAGGYYLTMGSSAPAKGGGNGRQVVFE